MPRVKAKILSTNIDPQGHFLAHLQFNRKMPPKGSFVDVQWGAKRSLMQNAFYWEYLTFLWEDCNLKEEYLTIEELHETLKATFLSERIISKNGVGVIIKVGSTTALDKVAFGEYMDRIDKAIVAFHCINTSAFWQEYEQNYKI